MTMLQRLTYTVSEVAQLLGISRSKAYDLVAEGLLPIVPLPGRRAGEARLADGGEERAVREVDPAVFDGEAVVRVEGVHAGREVVAVGECPRAGSAVDLDRVLDRHGPHGGGGAGEDCGWEVVAEHGEPCGVE